MFVIQEINDEKGSLSGKIIGECTGLSYGARDDFQRALLYLLPGGDCSDRWHKGASYSAEGFQLLASGEKEKAIQCFNQSLAVFRESGDREGEESVNFILAMIYQSLSWECHLAHDYHHAEEFFKRHLS